MIINAPGGSYPVRTGRGLLRSLGEQPRLRDARASAIFMVTSPEIDQLWGDVVRDGLRALKVPVHTLHVPAGEQHKRLATVDRLCEAMADLRADRDALLLALGGGVIGDITGFVAAVYMRGVRYVGLPTTLLAQVDSSVGGKTGVNLAAGKNLLGSFHHPIAVFADANALTTLPARELRAGLQESLKAAILGDAAMFVSMERDRAQLVKGDAAALAPVIERSIAIKAAVVEADERESGLRMTLNLGHTIGHAIESATGYSRLLHGEAVGWGMITAVRVAEGRGAMRASDAERVVTLIHGLTELPRFEASAEALVERTATDKKHRSGRRAFVLPLRIGEVQVVYDVSDAELLGATERMLDEVREGSGAVL